MKRVALGLVGLLLVSASATSADAPGVRPRALTKHDAAARLRVFGSAGDPTLENPAVTAVVRKTDGFLVDFWRNRPVLPTTAQLGTLTDIDALWQVHPIVRFGDKSAPALASRVSSLTDGIEVEGVAVLEGVRYRTRTVHRLHPREPRLTITTTFSVEGGAASGPIELGDEVKWGNTRYYVEGLGQPRLKYEGAAKWVGRRGAGGDLMLRPGPGKPMWLDYTSAKQPGFQGALTALFFKGKIAAGESVTVSRELGFEKIPVAEPAPLANPGTLRVEVRDEGGRPIAAKLRVDREGDKDAVFPPDGDLDGSDRFLWTGNGQVSRALAPGRYRLLITAGIERDAFEKSVTIRAGAEATIEARLPRVIDTPGWIAADLHLHQAPSVDADIGLPERVVAVAAEGVEFAVATDHYVVTDLAPTVRWLEQRGLLSSKLSTVVGSEVSTLGRRFGHFNVFPLKVGDNVRYVDVTPGELFADARRASPGGVLQVNHPRLDPKLGYFTYHQIDDATGEMKVAGYDPKFDTLEVYNGDDAWNLKAVKKVLADWMHLLGRGHRYAATGSSDSHSLAFLDPGLPRTLIRYGRASSDADDVSAKQADVLAALKAGRAIVTSGPIIEASIEGKGPGETARGKTARLRVVVRAAPWIDVRALEILEGAQAKRVVWQQIPRSRRPLRLEKTFDLPVNGPTFFVVTAQGERGLPNAARDGTTPFGFTNPIWVEP
ncbi:MAG: CehA/McbA family metallohydrolase [Polyangiaceae bacterium]|nr:CehA/McbA family metallohydrolase [Polyangiaceae bacterium]